MSQRLQVNSSLAKSLGKSGSSNVPVSNYPQNSSAQYPSKLITYASSGGLQTTKNSSASKLQIEKPKETTTLGRTSSEQRLPDRTQAGVSRPPVTGQPHQNGKA